MKPFKPSEVILYAIPPLSGTMGKAEIEHAAAMLTRACQVKGDVWGPILPKEMGEVLKSDLENNVEPWKSLNHNPFFRPDFWLMVEKGFARWCGEAGTSAIEFTEKGIESMRERWVIQ